MIDHLLIHRAKITDVRRTAGTGGAWPETRTMRAENVPCRRSPASVSEQTIALNRGSVVTHSVWFRPDQAVEIDDELEIDGTVYYVRGHGVMPSIPIYRKVLVEERVRGS